jgi:hypothetical protein
LAAGHHGRPFYPGRRSYRCQLPNPAKRIFET